MEADPELRDEPLEREIALVGALVLAAAQSPGALGQEEIDAVLGIDPQPAPSAETS